jgi:integrase
MLYKHKLSLTAMEKYRLPRFIKSKKDSYVCFYVLDPESILKGEPRLKRIRVKFNHIPNKKERSEVALRFCNEVAVKLQQGWNPLIADTGKKGFTLITTIFNRYEIYIKKLWKDGAIKDKTKIDYLNRLKQIIQYNESLVEKMVYVYQFDQSYIEGFLEHIYIDRDNSARTRNNYLRWISSLCTYLKNNGYLNDNSAERITFLREAEKKRKPLNKEELKRLVDYLTENNPHFLLACMTHYYTLVRPNELSNIKIDDISISEQTMFISKEISKNSRDAKVTITSKLLAMMIDSRIFNYPSNYYLFGKGFIPSAEKADSRIFREEWARVRRILKWPETYQFYSLKDTGITDTIDRVGLSIAKDQARHSSVATTNKYIRKEQLIAHPELKNFDGDF